MTKLEEIGRKPADVEISAIEEAAIGRCDEPHVGRSENRAPRNFRSYQRCGAGFTVRRQSTDISELFGIAAHFFLGAIAIEEEKHDRPDDAQQRENVENPAPAPR